MGSYVMPSAESIQPLRLQIRYLATELYAWRAVVSLEKTLNANISNSGSAA